MPIDAKITRFRTRPYDSLETGETNIMGYEKVLDEELIEKITAENLNDLRQRILKLVENYSSDPIIVTTRDDNEDPAVKHSFLIERGYQHTDNDAILETILYQPKNITSYREKKEKEMKAWATKRATKAEQAEFIRNAIPHLLENAIQGMDSLDEILKKMGFADGQEFNVFLIDLYSKRNNFATEEQFSDYFWEKYINRINEHAPHKSFPTPPSPAFAPYLSSIVNDEMAILCRIIGKDSVLVSLYQDYYFKWHRISEPVLSVSNHADDKDTTRYVYNKDSFGGR